MTNAEAQFNKSLRPRKPEGSLERTAQDVHLDSHTALELWSVCPIKNGLKLASGLEASRCAKIIRPGSGRTETACCQFPASRFDCVLPQTAWIMLCKSDLVLADCVTFWPNGSGAEASWCARIVWSASGQRFRADPDRM